MAHDLVFAFLAGVSMSAYSILLRLASSGIHPALGATIITGVAFLANLALTLTLRATGSSVTFTPQSVYLVTIVGLAAACADFFTLSAYASGLRVTSSFVIGGTSTILVLLVGFMVLREPFTWTKLFAVALIAIGVFLLQREGL
jgi:drug/metabolite transporter (DMT)-like permease